MSYWQFAYQHIYVQKEKFRNMKFNRLSPTTDFYSKFQSQMTVMNQNILYVTHECDKILKLVKEIADNKNLQRQVDDYFEEDKEDNPEVEDGNRTN